MGEIHVMCDKGDITVTWNPEDDESTEQAKGEFQRLKVDGYEFYAPSADGRGRGRKVKNWKADRGVLIAAPGVKKPAERKAGTRPKAMAGGPVLEHRPHPALVELSMLDRDGNKVVLYGRARA